MSKRTNLLLLEDMLESAEKIIRYTRGLTYDSFIKDEKTLDATVRNFEIIGEAANRLDDDFRSENPEVEWKRIRGFRNRIVQDYFGTDYQIVWSTTENNLKELIEQVKKLLSKFSR